MEGDHHGNTASAGVLDALLASINTEGLTASSLQQSLTAMDARQQEVLRALLERTQAACAAPAAPAGALAEEAACAAALASLADRGLAEGSEPLAAAAALAAQDAAAIAALTAAQAAAAEAGAQAGLQQRLAEYDTMVAAGAFRDAAALITQMELEGGGGDAAAGVAERLRLFREYVATAPPQYLVVDPGTHVPALVPPAAATGPALQQLWSAAAALGELPAALRALGDSMVERCVKPLLAAEAEAAVGPGGVMESPAGSVASSALSAATAAGGRAARAGAERALYRAMKALCDAALGGSPDLAGRLGEAFWPAAAAAYVAARLAPFNPVADSELVGFMRAGSLAVKLEQKAVKLGLWSSTKEGPVARYVRVTVGRVLAAKRVAYAAAARDLLTSGAATEAVTVTAAAAAARPGAARALFPGGGGGGGGAAAELAGEAPVGDVGPYGVSRAAEGLVALMHEALGEACRSGSAALAQAMAGAVVDLASLLLALGEAGAAASEVPYVAALRYCDCMHVSRALCALPAAHAPRLQALVHPAVNFLGPAERVRAAGEAALAACMARQREELAAAAAELRRWRGLDGPGAIRCNKAARQLLAAFARLGAALAGVLPRGAFVATAAAAADSVAGPLADAILAMDDISADESDEIPKILGILTSGESGMLAAAGAGAGAGDAAPQVAAALAGAAGEVSRLREVVELLEVPSREIALRWRSGRLAAAGLARDQVVGLVRALFEDNEYSRASLNAILSS